MEAMFATGLALDVGVVVVFVMLSLLLRPIRNPNPFYI
jgi:hypothetical protein